MARRQILIVVVPRAPASCYSAYFFFPLFFRLPPLSARTASAASTFTTFILPIRRSFCVYRPSSTSPPPISLPIPLPLNRYRLSFLSRSTSPLNPISLPRPNPRAPFRVALILAFYLFPPLSLHNLLSSLSHLYTSVCRSVAPLSSLSDPPLFRSIPLLLPCFKPKHTPHPPPPTS